MGVSKSYKPIKRALHQNYKLGLENTYAKESKLMKYIYIILVCQILSLSHQISDGLLVLACISHKQLAIRTLAKNLMSEQHHYLATTTIVPVYQFWSLCTSYHNHRQGVSLAWVTRYTLWLLY